MDIAHGGNVNAAARLFNIPLEQWTDLSTGISPWSWPVPALPQAVWQSLPYANDELECAAANYYGCQREAVLAVPGSQYALQYVPALLRRGRVAMPLRGYAEHRAAWRAAGHQIVDYEDAAALQHLMSVAAVDHALVINPNNPTGEQITRQLLQDLYRQLHTGGGWLVVDEAFADISPHLSVAARCPLPGLIVYRSIGKFFGLAGVRLGFMLAPSDLCRELAAKMPPWLLSNPAWWIGVRVLSDGQWQRDQRERLGRASASWLQTLQAAIPRLRFSHTALFAAGEGDARYCETLYYALARRAVLVRLFDDMDGRRMLRFGLPLTAARERLERQIAAAVEDCACVMD